MASPAIAALAVAAFLLNLAVIVYIMRSVRRHYRRADDSSDDDERGASPVDKLAAQQAAAADLRDSLLLVLTITSALHAITMVWPILLSPDANVLPGLCYVNAAAQTMAQYAASVLLAALSVVQYRIIGYKEPPSMRWTWVVVVSGIAVAFFAGLANAWPISTAAPVNPDACLASVAAGPAHAVVFIMWTVGLLSVVLCAIGKSDLRIILAIAGHYLPLSELLPLVATLLLWLFAFVPSVLLASVAALSQPEASNRDTVATVQLWVTVIALIVVAPAFATYWRRWLARLERYRMVAVHSSLELPQPVASA